MRLGTYIAPETNEDEAEPVIVVCQGPPVCGLKGNEAVQAQENGCPWCKRITMHSDGSESIADPAAMKH